METKTYSERWVKGEHAASLLREADEEIAELRAQVKHLGSEIYYLVNGEDEPGS